LKRKLYPISLWFWKETPNLNVKKQLQNEEGGGGEQYFNAQNYRYIWMLRSDIGSTDLLGLAAWLAVSYEPLESYVDIVLLLAGDGIAADLPVLQMKWLLLLLLLAHVIGNLYVKDTSQPKIDIKQGFKKQHW